MSSGISRRDFLKLANYLPASLYTSNMLKALNVRAPSSQKNVIIVVFDALSAHNMSLYGYGRRTTPNIDRLAERAIVYHNHISGSNYTTSGTASILTGTLPWTHRALQPNDGVVDEYIDKSIFSVFNDYYCIAYSHNEWVNTFFEQFRHDLDEWIPREQLYLFSSDAIIQKLFPNDRDISSVAWARNVKIKDQGYAYSLYLSRLVSYFEQTQIAKYISDFPKGLPTAHADNGFLLEHAVDDLLARTKSISSPFLGYFHFLPPHDPYRPPREFATRFTKDEYRPLEKPLDLFATEHSDQADVNRALYDEFILYIDREFGRLYGSLEEAGVLEDTWLVFTSDHGESFERGIVGHVTEALYQPLIHAPLLIFEPGRTTRQDIFARTSVVDLLPTLASLTGKNIPQWSEGRILPPFQDADAEQGIFAVRSYTARENAPLTQASVSLIKGRYKLHYYFGYPEINVGELVKLYDIETDPGELVDLAVINPQKAQELLNEIKVNLAAADKPYV